MRLKIKNLRAIENADISLDGISVISGLNGSGKSTIAKLLYDVLSTAIDFNELVDQDLNRSSLTIAHNLSLINETLSGLIPEEMIKQNKETLIPTWFSFFDNQKNHLFVNRNIDTLQEFFKHIPQKLSAKQTAQVQKIRKLLLESAGIKSDDGLKSVHDLLLKVQHRINRWKQRTLEEKERRSVNLFQSFWTRYSWDSAEFQCFELYEHDLPVMDRDNQTVTTLHSVTKVCYIDTPMALGEKSYQNKRHWRDLNDILESEELHKAFSFDNSQDLGLLAGNAHRDDDNRFIYTRPDGETFNLLECATGLKSFSILQMLFKNGFIDSKTLLIIDEPEAHLHPQWIVEYARLLVRMHKEIGIRFLIASHNPDMVSAIKHISEKEFGIDEVKNHLNYYLAKPAENSYRYVYHTEGTDIENIFESFNIALDRMSLYGTDSF